MFAVFLPVAAALAAVPGGASTTASVGPLTVTGLDGHARHTHGGPPARLGHARFRVTRTGLGRGRLTVQRIEFLTGHSCEAPPAEVSGTPRFGGLLPEDGSLAESVLSLGVGPGTVDVMVGFEAVEAYYSWCDRFAFRVTFDADGEPLTVVAETQVTRVEPLP
jgi:hypothetical protein